MKKRFSFSHLLHNDKLMMLISLVLAFVIWWAVVYGPTNTETRVITGVPVSITLNDYASETLKLRITKGAEATATVKVEGIRSVVGALSPQDITITADTGNVISEGTYTLPLRATSSGNFTIKSVVGTDGNNDTVTISCDSWREVAFPVEVEMSGLQVSDTEKFQFGTPSVSGDAIDEGKITVSGPRTDMNRIHTVLAVIEEEKTIDEASVFEATLQARDEDGQLIETVAFEGVESGKVSVTVPVMVYRKVKLKPLALHTPKGYEGKKDLITVTPSTVELWGVPSEIDEYVASIQEQIRVDFDTLTNENLTKEITLEPIEGIRPVNGSETITVKVGLAGIAKRTMEIDLTKDNFIVTNTPGGMKTTLAQTKLATVELYGPAADVQAIKPQDIRVNVDMANVTAAGQQTVIARLSVSGKDNVWVCYGKEAAGVDILVSVSEN